MYNREKMNQALRAFDQSAVLSLLPDQNSDTIRELLADISKSGCLIRLYALTLEQEEHRAQMIEWLKELTAKRPQESKYVKFLLDQVEITELTLAEIESSVKDDLFSTLPMDQQAWSALEWAGREMLSVQRQMEEGLRDRSEDDQVIIDPLNLWVDKEHGYGLAAGRVHQLSQTIANTLRMLGHRHGWGASGSFAIPAKVETTDENLSAAARISRLGDIWRNVLDLSKHHRYWGGHFEVRKPDDEQRTVLPDVDIVVLSATTERERRDDVQISEYIASTRMERLALSAFMGVQKMNAKARMGNPRVEAVALPPDEIVSELEMATFYLLDRHMHFSPGSNTITFSGLTIREWLRGYCVLEESYARQPTELLHGILGIDLEELQATLERAGLSALKARTFIERVTFKSGRRDLYDAPLLATSDGNLFFLASLYRGIDATKIISSQIGTERLNIKSKGKDFEKFVLQVLRQSGLNAQSFRYKIERTEYDCDAALLWDQHLFIFECKNYSLPTADPADRLFFWKRQVEALQQVERIADDLSNYPQIVRKHFGSGATWNSVHPVVLNAFCFSLPRSPKGTYFYDASALDRFLKIGTLNEVISAPGPGSKTEVSVITKRLWRGDRPTPEDLVREMQDPSQITMETDKYYLARKLLRVSKSTAVAFVTPASKPPDFEPMATAEQPSAGTEQTSTG